MSKLSFRARALDASKPMPIYLAEELPDLPDYSAINRAVPQMPSGMEKEEESEHHLQKAISGTGLIIPTPEVCGVDDLEFYERCYPSDYKMPKQHIHMQPLWEEQEAPEYDIDSEDERWLKQQRHPELTELKFEQMMDKLEKSSGQTVVTLNEAKLLLERSDDLVIAVYDYWLNKRLNTQHPLILSVKTEHRPGQSSNNPYLAFRRRTEKMQTRKNRKNDESSYEKMLKLRRDLARALTLLEMVARRENAKKELVKLTALIAERRYHAGDFANQLLPDPPPRPTYNTVPLSPATFRRETYTIPHYPPRPPPTPVDQPRQREKRPYKRRKHRHPAVGSGQGPRDTAACTSSEEDSGSRADAATPPDDGPFAFRRKPGCYYEMPTSTLYGDPVDPESTSKDAMFEHEIDERHRYTLTSLRHPYQRCIGFARRRMCRGGRVALDRIATPLDDLWPKLPFTFTNSSQYRAERDEQIDMETKAHRTPKVMTRDFHTSGKYPWRHAFRQHLSRHPELWLEAPKPELELPEIKIEPMDFKCDDMPLKMEDDLSMDIDCAKNVMDGISIDIDGFKHDTDSVKNEEDSVKSDININRTIDGVVRANLDRVLRKRSWSGCSDSSYDSDESLQPVEKEFGNFISEVNKKWLHFRPKTPPPSPPQNDDLLSQQFPLGLDTPFTIELRAAETPPSDALDSFVTSEFSLGQLIPEVAHDADHSGHSMDISDDMLPDHFTGLTEAQVESILSETDLKALAEDDKKIEMSADILDELVNNVDGKDSFLLQGQSSDGRADSGPRKRKQAEAFGSTVVSVRPVDREPIMLDTVPPAPVVPAVVAAPVVAPIIKATPPKAALPKAAPPKAAPPKAAPPNAAPVPATRNKPAPAEHKHTPVPVADIIVEEVNELPPVKLEKKQKEDTIEEIQLSHGVQLKTVQTRHSPLKKHIITSTTHRRPVDSTVVTSVTTDVAPPAHSQPQIVTVAVSDSLKVYHQVRLQNHLLSTQSGVLVQNGPFPPVAVAVPVQQNTNATVGVASVANVTGVSTVGSVGSVAAVATVSGVSVSASGMATGIGAVNRRVSTPLVQLGSTLAHKHVHIHPPHGHASPPVVVAQSHTIHHVAPNKLKVIHAHPITQTQRTQLLAQNRTIAGLPAVVSLATIGEAKAPNALLKAAPGSVAQLFEIKSGQLGKGPHLVNVVRQPAPGKTTVTRLDLNDKKRHVVATLDGALKGNLAAATRPHRVNLSLDGRQIIRTAIPAVRAPQLRQQIQLKNRLQVSAPQLVRSGTEASTSITIAAPTKSTSLPSSVVANLLHKNVQLPKGGPKIAISGAGGAALAANVQAIAFTTAAQLKARQARLITQPRPTPVPEMAEATTVGSSSSSTPSSMPSGTPMESVAEGEDVATNGTVRRRTADTLPMEVT